MKGAYSCMRFMSIDVQHNLLSIQHKNVTKRFNQCVMYVFSNLFSSSSACIECKLQKSRREACIKNYFLSHVRKFQFFNSLFLFSYMFIYPFIFICRYFCLLVHRMDSFHIIIFNSKTYKKFSAVRVERK